MGKSLESKKQHPLIRKEEAPDLDGVFLISLLLAIFPPPICSKGRLQQQHEELGFPGSSLCVFHVPCSVQSVPVRCCSASLLADSQRAAPLGQDLAALSGRCCGQRALPADPRVNV